MPLPLTEPATLFEELLQDLPPAASQMVRECQAFVRAKKVQMPAPLLRVVFFACGLDKAWRVGAGTGTARYEASTDHAVAARVRAGGPWVQALRRRRRSPSSGGTWPPGRRLGGIAASSMQAPGAPGPAHRRHSARARVSWPCLEGWGSAVPTGATRTHFPLAPGAIAVADRGDAPCQGMPAAVPQGAALMVRRQPFSVLLRDAAGAPVALCVTLKRQTMETLRTLAVPLCAAGGPHAVQGWGPAYRLHEAQAQRARHQCRQGHQKGTPSAERLLVAGWGLVFPPLAPAGLTAQPRLALYRWRGHVAIAIQRSKSGLEVEALWAQAPSPLAEVWLPGTVR
jgi:hypothetical protein